MKAVLAAGALALLLHTVTWGDLTMVMRHANPLWVLAALALLPFNVGLETYRWWRLLRRVSAKVRYRDALAAVLAGYPLGLLTPARLGDYVGRAALLREVRPGVSAALTFAERMATLLWCLLAGLAALVPYLATHASASPLWPALVGASALGTIALLTGLLMPSRSRALLSTLIPLASVRRALRAFDRVPSAEATRLVLLSGLRYGIFTLQFACLVQALAPGTAWADAVTGIALVFFAKSVLPQVTLGDLGIRESASVFFLSAYGVSEAAALEASLGVFGINLFLPALLGVPMLFRLRLRRASIAKSLPRPA